MGNNVATMGSTLISLMKWLFDTSTLDVDIDVQSAIDLLTMYPLPQPLEIKVVNDIISKVGKDALWYLPDLSMFLDTTYDTIARHMYRGDSATKVFKDMVANSASDADFKEHVKGIPLIEYEEPLWYAYEDPGILDIIVKNLSADDVSVILKRLLRIGRTASGRLDRGRIVSLAILVGAYASRYRTRFNTSRLKETLMGRYRHIMDTNSEYKYMVEGVPDILASDSEEATS